MRTDDEIKARIQIYKKHFTEKVAPPDCTNCNRLATVYDQCAGDNYCDDCLEKSLREEVDTLFDYTDGKAPQETLPCTKSIGE